MVKSSLETIILLLPLMIGLVLCESSLPVSWPRPEVSILFICIVALRCGSQAGLAMGFLAGLFLGLLSSYSVGALTITYALLGYFIGKFLHPYNSRPLIYFLAVVLSTVVLGVTLYFFGRFDILVLPKPPLVRDWLLKVLLCNIIFLWPTLKITGIILGNYVFRPLKLDC
ncbi:hypothetical protein IJT10_02505 [bacterium]|nr:hypothetical protein [bacterium]